MNERHEVRFYLGWCSGPGERAGLREFFRRPRNWLSVYSLATGGEITLRHWRWGMIKWGFHLRQQKT